MEPCATATRAGQRQAGNSAAASKIDARAFRRALSQFATGVAVVTARDPSGPPLGLTISSFNAVSIDPPSSNDTCRIGSPDRGPISGQQWSTRLGRCGAPLLAGALAHFECVPYAN